jgi:predicted ATP-dependent endonuclease of OLD family
MIDEPELNLHPENQRAFARFLVKLVNVGVKVFITTHSDTMIREFNTLMMFHRRLEHMEKVRIRHGYEESEFLAPENIHLYMARSRNVTREKSTLELMIPDVKLGVDADIFDETISTMNNVQDDLRYGVI